MVVMAEGDSALMFMSDASSTSNSHNGAATAAALANLEATMTSDSDSEGVSMVAARFSVAQTKRRNKRKNFQPRNIAYSEDGEPSAKRERRSSAASTSSGGSEYGALDLSSAELPPRHEEDERPEPSPMDLTCSKSASPFGRAYCSDDSDSDDKRRSEPEHRFSRLSFGEAGSQELEQQRRRVFNAFKPSAAYLAHPFLGQPGESSDLKEYAVNTFKELLEIYGLNSDATDVTQSIANNVSASGHLSGEYPLHFSVRVDDPYGQR